MAAARGIIGHEVAHIVNRDPFSPQVCNSGVTEINFLSSAATFIFTLILPLLNLIPIVAPLAVILFAIPFRISSFALLWARKLLMEPAFELIQQGFSRWQEYRCDRQSAAILSGVGIWSPSPTMATTPPSRPTPLW